MRINRKLSYILLCAMACGASHTATAQSKLSPNTVQYLQSHRQHVQASEQTRLQAFLFLSDASLERTKIETLGIHINTDRDDILTIDAPINAIARLQQLDGVKYVQIASDTHTMMDNARIVGNVDAVQQGSSLAQSYSGKGVVVGIIDAGFDYTHPAFRDQDRNTLRIKRVWEQGYSKGTPPTGFSYGTELTSEQEILTAAADYSSNSHGTHVASIAAGNDRTGDGVKGNPYYGIAGDAELILVSKGEITPNNVNISDAIAYIFDYAQSIGKPCVVNMSLGMQIGPHDGSAPFDLLSDRLVGAGKLLVGSAGNHGHNKLHTSRRFATATDAPLRTFIDFVDDVKSGGQLDIWGEKDSQLDLRLLIVGKSKGAAVDSSQVIDLSLAAGGSYIYSPTKSSSGNITITTEINPLNGKPHALISFALTQLRMNYFVGIELSARSAGEVHLWGDDSNIRLTNNNMEGWTDGDTERTIAEIGGTGTQILSVGAYTSRDYYLSSGNRVASGETLGTMASFSSKGPTTDNRMKPEIVAPGTYIIAAGNSYDGNISSFPLASEYVWNNRSYKYVFMQGTSMAAPFVTGVLATWLEANPQLSPDDVRNVWQQTAIQDIHTEGNVGTTEATYGWGKIDAHAGIQKVIKLGQNRIEHLQGDISSAQPAIYTLSGTPITGTAIDRLPKGIYIVRDGNQTKKIIK